METLIGIVLFRGAQKRSELFEGMSDVFYSNQVIERGTSYQVDAGIFPYGSGGERRGFRLVDKSDLGVRSPYFDELAEYDKDFWLMKWWKHQALVSKDLSKSSRFFKRGEDPVTKGEYIEIPKEGGMFGLIPRSDISKYPIVFYSGIPRDWGKLKLATWQKDIYFLMDPNHPEVHTDPFYGEPEAFAGLWKVGEVYENSPSGLSYFIAQDDIMKSSDSFSEGPWPFDGHLMVKADYFRIYSATNALAASPWFVEEPELANGSLLVRLGNKNLQLLKRHQPEQASIPFKKIVKGASGGLGRLFGSRRAFDKWLLVEDMDGKQVWLSTEDHSVRPYEGNGS